MWKGMNMEDIKRCSSMDSSLQINELSKKIEKLNLDIMQGNQREIEKDREIIHEKAKNQQLKQEYDYIQDSKKKEINNYEVRINGLKNQYENQKPASDNTNIMEGTISQLRAQNACLNDSLTFHKQKSEESFSK